MTSCGRGHAGQPTVSGVGQASQSRSGTASSAAGPCSASRPRGRGSSPYTGKETGQLGRAGLGGDTGMLLACVGT